eukprot:CAMPEP_0181096448 /NCGR_PEP_ID=MMETSP1071-20121207/11038_1 /TAXON_ID=35127 /ORGANISM="Thalassiosira sp., Strain NH16" /LENGTH=337 /DNA_ID=CAMNT_0023178857 /DNA_START=44 /DNA_END=1057 /DNA_ORIENTATION=-
MKALQWNGKALELIDAPDPTPKPNHAILRIALAGICNTDIEIVKGYMGFEGILGHEFVGIVEDVGDGDNDDEEENGIKEQWMGKRVCVDINIPPPDLQRVPFDADVVHHAAGRSVVGIMGHQGAFAERIQVPLCNLFAVPDNVTNDEAVFVEPLAAAFEIPHQCSIRKCDKVVVMGDGKLGLLIAMALRLSSDDVTLLGRHAEKLALVEDLGVHTALMERGDDAACPIPVESADFVVEATGTASGLGTALSLARPRGTIVLKSTVADSESLNLAPVVINELTVVGSRCGPFDKALDALAEKRVPVERLIQERFGFGDAVEAFEAAQRRGMLKVLLDF